MTTAADTVPELMSDFKADFMADTRRPAGRASALRRRAAAT